MDRRPAQERLQLLALYCSSFALLSKPGVRYIRPNETADLTRSPRGAQNSLAFQRQRRAAARGRIAGGLFGTNANRRETYRTERRDCRTTRERRARIPTEVTTCSS